MFHAPDLAPALVRSIRIPALRPLVCFGLVASLACAAASAAPTVSVPLAPTPLPTPEGRVLVYELSIRTPADEACARLVDVLAQGGHADSALERRYQGSIIAANAMVYSAQMESIPVTQTVDIPPGGGAVVYLQLTLADGKPAPESLNHRLRFTACDTAAMPDRLVTLDIPVSRQPPVVVGLPFRGEGWVASDSVHLQGVHRRTLIPLFDSADRPLVGQFHVPERYAIDWVKVDPQARRAVGPVDVNASYLAYGAEVIAVADGVISSTRDGLPDGTPPFNPPGATVKNAAGNYIMQDIGNGHFAFYAHLVPGGLLVKQGDRVTRGQVLAVLGNSGNSSEAHLHFHVSDANDPLVSEGLPFVFDEYGETGHAEVMNEVTGLFDDHVHHAAVPRRNLMPSSYSVLTTEAPADAPPRSRPPSLDPRQR